MICPFTVGLVALIVTYYVICLVLRSLKIGKVTDKHVLITGCDSGFGKLAASRLDKLGFHVFAACLTKDGASSLSETCSSRLTTLILDVSSIHSIEQAFQFVQEKLPPDTGLWALINNAGIAGLFAPGEFCTRQDMLQVLNVNLFGVIDVTHQFLPLIRKSKGRVVNTSSVSGRLAFFALPYTVSKFGVEAFSGILRREVRSQGIKVSIIEPGSFRTSIVNLEKIMSDAQEAVDRQSPEVQAAYGGSNVMRKTHELMMTVTKEASNNLDHVVDAYIHAITSRFPKTRYPVGYDANLFYIPISHELMMTVTKEASNNLDHVVDAYIHAITSRFPKTRYPVGYDANLFYIPICNLPDWISDLILPRLT